MEEPRLNISTPDGESVCPVQPACTCPTDSWSNDLVPLNPSLTGSAHPQSRNGTGAGADLLDSFRNFFGNTLTDMFVEGQAPVRRSASAPRSRTAHGAGPQPDSTPVQTQKPLVAPQTVAQQQRRVRGRDEHRAGQDAPAGLLGSVSTRAPS